ncbi:MAG TPA: asparagine synthase (glutamine-hydrolyzing) [Humidesulfovibrio sp.]|uniref:asparagine synthase (glutamine-hydrolyzing) n=1 Tax=Humidesulfovibrio sp. TaxID=2910988 RepID=UPI002CC20444|nr:asparagine synthase (glutamine-hydrolyzing) [Humidesulfovibrio sp.]HWR02653.1 asparagine synthase (glutamine-hydrolyzing) [Humidesulfovibrio sp.]
MCGILGIIALGGASWTPEAALIERMRDTMAHRGPDGAGLWIAPDQRCALAHRRLSIIDLSETAGQPMHSSCGRYHLTFNGEIYNHAELRQELVTLGHTAWQTSHSDTEVILKAYAQWGRDCVQRFRGMFAFGLYDSQERTLWLVRDRLGIKPLYYSTHHGRLGFASEIKALLEDPEQPRAMDPEAFYHFLSFLTTPAPQTLFKGVRKLPCGSWLTVAANGDIAEHRYWDPLDSAISLAGASDREMSERILAELEAAVRYRKVSDVPVGVFLSGGIDSSTNAALFSRGESQAVKTFSIGYEGSYASYQNELHFARRMADEIGAEHHELKLTQDDLMDFLPRMVWLQDEPIADPVCVPVYYVSKLARDNGVKVCQVGEGSDELFCGYPSWGNAVRVAGWNRLPVPRFLKALGCRAAEAIGKTNSHKYAYLRRAVDGQPIFWSGAEAFFEHQKPGLLGPALRNQLAGLSTYEAVLKPLRQRFLQRTREASDLNWMTYSDLNIRLPELLLMRVDKMSMGVSLECRVPFLDHKLVELAMAIPAASKYQKGEPKRLLKRAVRGIIPDEIIDRPKQGFGVPVYEWCLDRLGQQMRTTLEEFCKETGLLDWNEITRYLDRQAGAQLWYLYNFALWWKGYLA